MNMQTGMIAIGTYAGTPTANLAALIALLGDPDALVTDARAAGSNLDEMSPVARAQLVTELEAFQTALNGGADGVAFGQHTVLAADATEGLVNIVTGLADTSIANIGVTVTRAGAIVTADAVITEPAAGTIRVADGTAYNTTAGDIITWFARDPAV